MCHLNESIKGATTPEGVKELAKSLMDKAGIKTLRKDAVLGIECLFSLPSDHGIDEIAYFQECTQWIQIQFACHVLSADIHRDESCPHCHVLLLPMVNGKMIGSKLMGYKKNLSSLQEVFYENVSKRYGLERPPKALNNAQRKKTAMDVINHLVQTQDPVTKSNHWPSFVEVIYKFPIGFAKAIGIEISMIYSRPMKTMAQIFTSKGKGKYHRNLVYFEEEKQNICSVDFASKVISPHLDAESNAIYDSHRVVFRENEISSQEFNAETGEFRTNKRPNNESKG